LPRVGAADLPPLKKTWTEMAKKAAPRETSAKGLGNGPEPAGPTLTERTLERLRNDIVAGKFAASERLRVQELSALYGVGASPLREALAHLAADGLVATISNRGFRVAPMSVADFRDVSENRVRTECLALERSIGAGDDEWEAALVADYHRLRKFEATHSAQSQLNDPDFEWERRHRQFHHALIAACPSQWLLHFDRLLVMQFDRYRRLVMLKASTTKNGRQQEEALVEATLARKTAKATQILRAHIDDWSTTILKQLKERLAS